MHIYYYCKGKAVTIRNFKNGTIFELPSLELLSTIAKQMSLYSTIKITHLFLPVKENYTNPMGIYCKLI